MSERCDGCSQVKNPDGGCACPVTPAAPPRPPSDPVMYVFVRRDLGMQPGKVAAQACHAVHQLIKDMTSWDFLVTADDKWTNLYEEWDGGSYAKVVLQLPGPDSMADLVRRLEADGIPHSVVVDEGRTVVAPGSRTAMAVAPMDRFRGRLLFSGYRLY